MNETLLDGPDLSPAAQVIYNVVRFGGSGVTLGVIERGLTLAGHSPSGDIALRATAWRNVYMWNAINDDFIRWMHELTDPDLLHFGASSILAYGYDGSRVPGLPIISAEDLPPLGGQMREPHWLPVVLNVGPPREADPASTVGNVPHVLYRFYGLDGALLYVGLTMNPGTRFKVHSKQKPWWFDVKDINLEHFVSRSDVETAEREAIRAEQPRHNVVHNR